MLGVSDRFPLRRSPVGANSLPSVPARFGIRSAAQVARDFGEVARSGITGRRFQVDVSSAGLLRPDLSLAAYAGLIPRDGRAPIFNLFDRSGGGRRYTQRVTRRTLRDFRGGRLSYDEHDGTDFVCPIGTPLVAAAPGTVVMIRDRWLRGGLTVAVDHGDGLVTQYTHCAEATAPLGTRVKRGDQVALSGAAGLDLVQFFPWVPPHVHFMVYVDGVPVDPFLAAGEAQRAGTWLDPNEPRTSGPRSEDVEPPLSEVDESALERVIASCTDARIRGELAACKNEKAWMAALAEDALAHDAWAWPGGKVPTVRPETARKSGRRVGLTVPLPASAYTGIRFADAPWTAPRAAD